MPIELVKKPYVALIGSSSFEYTAVAEFAMAHGLSKLLEQDETPIGKIGNSSHSDTDLLAEFAGRFCYRAWAMGRETEDYIKNILSEGHGNVIAHPTYHFIITGVSRSLTHELIRHHVGTNPSQESQRYVTAEGGEIEIVGYKAMRAVVPPMILKLSENRRDPVQEHDAVLERFEEDYEMSLSIYHYWLNEIKTDLKVESKGLIDVTTLKKRANEAARCFLPNAAETRLVWTMNARAARWIIEQRGSVHADLEIRRLAVELTKILKQTSPVIFEDAEVYRADDGFDAVKVKYSKP